MQKLGPLLPKVGLSSYLNVVDGSIQPFTISSYSSRSKVSADFAVSA